MLTFIRASQEQELNERLLSRSPSSNPKEEAAVRAIIKAVQENGDEAVFSYTQEFDGFDVSAQNVQVTEREITDAFRVVPEQIRNILVEAAANIELFHKHQLRDDWFIERPDGSFVGMVYRAVASAGVYVPGGTAAYPSSVLMNIIPAKCAGVPRVIVTTPAVGGRINPVTLVAAHVAGADAIYKVGGAQAVAALAFGTKTIPRVDVIAGPGNIYVALAKRMLYGQVGLDMIAGPSEIAIIADAEAPAAYAASDLLSQAEHDVLAAAILITPDETLARRVDRELEKQLADLPRKNIAAESLRRYGTVVLCEDLAECCTVSDRLAPEHLEILTAEPQKLLFEIRNAGSIFLGSFSPEPLGDYYAGANHVLPTNGTARFASPLNVDNFRKKSSVIYYTREEMQKAADRIAKLARAEGLEAHARSAELRNQVEADTHA